MMTPGCVTEPLTQFVGKRSHSVEEEAVRSLQQRSPVCKHRIALQVKYLVHPIANLLHCAMAQRKRIAVVQEGPDAARRFEDTMGRVLQVSKEELGRREAAYQDARADKPSPGPKSIKKA